MNYKELLTKYIQHVRECEGVDFISKVNHSISDVYFNTDEFNELQRLRK